MIKISSSCVIETPRLILRAPQIGDGLIINESINKSIMYLKKWMIWAQQPQTLEKSENYVKMCINNWASFKNDLPLFIFLKTSNTHIGGTGFHSLNWDIPSFETGYWLRVDHQNQGYMTEALNAIIRYAFIQFKANRLEILCDVNNLRSYNLSICIKSQIFYMIFSTQYDFRLYTLLIMAINLFMTATIATLPGFPFALSL